MEQVVAITGFGLACALGTSRAEVSRRLRSGERPFAPVRRFDASAFRVNLAAEVVDPDFVGRWGRSALRHLSRTDLLAGWAVADALEQAHLDLELRQHTGFYVGASTGGMATMEDVLARRGTPSFSDYVCYPVWATSRVMGDRFDLGGYQSTFMTACSSAAHAIGRALRDIRSGVVQRVVCGGCESMSRLTLAGFGALGVLDPQGTRPFDAERRGITLGEGAAFFVLESVQSAQKRGAEILALAMGYGAAAEAHHMVHPKEDGSGARTAMEQALRDAGLDPSIVDYVNAHGTGTKQNDAMESRALDQMFSGAKKPYVSSSKSMVGHSLGAAGAVEAALSLLGMVEGFVPPNPGVQTPLAELTLPLVRQTVYERPNVVLSSSFAFGGNNAALLLAQPTFLQSSTTRVRPARERVLISSVAMAWGDTVLHELQHFGEFLGKPEDHNLQFVTQYVHELLDKSVARRMDPLSQLASVLCTLAFRQTNVLAKDKVAIGFGSSFGALDATAAFLQRLFDKGPTLVNPLDFPNLVHNAPAGYASLFLGAHGANLSSCQEELAGFDVLRQFYDDIAYGREQLALAGGGDLHSELLARGYQNVDRVFRMKSQHQSVAAVVALERRTSVQSRGHKPWAEVLGVGFSGPQTGLVAAVAMALGHHPSYAPIDRWYCGGSIEVIGEDALASVGECAKGAARVVNPLAHASGGSVAMVALAAAQLARAQAQTILVTQHTRSGNSVAILLGKPG